MSDDTTPSDREPQGERKWLISRISQMAEALDTELLHELYDFAGELTDNPRLVGGPFDGLRLTGSDYRCFVYVKSGEGQVAVYEENQNGQLAFTRMRKTGEGCMPHIYPEKQNGHQG